MSKPNAQDYNRILKKAWTGVTPEEKKNVHRRHAATYVRAMHKKWLGKKLTMPIKYTSGNRDTWVRWDRKTQRQTLFINPEEGWRHINHNFTHWLERAKTGLAHSNGHLEMEREGATLIRRRFLTLDPDPDVKPKGPSRPRMTVVEFGEANGVTVEKEWWEDNRFDYYVYDPKVIDTEDDPHYGDHYVHTAQEARERIRDYIANRAN